MCSCWAFVASVRRPPGGVLRSGVCHAWRGCTAAAAAAAGSASLRCTFTSAIRCSDLSKIWRRPASSLEAAADRAISRTVLIFAFAPD